VNGELVPVDALGTETCACMCALLDRHFEGVDPGQFERDLRDKHWALVLRDERRELVGFSTFAVVRVDAGGDPLAVVYSGDTIVDPSCWGSTTLARSWITAVRQLGAAHPGLPLVWLLICSGYRTYRFLPVFFRDFYPRHDRPTPRAARRLMSTLARRRYGEAFEPRRGVVSLSHPQPLRAHLLGAPAARHDAHIEFFERANPGHLAGDELVCMTSLDVANLTRAGRRMIRVGEARLAAV